MRVRYRTKDSSTISAQHYSAANGDAVKCTARCCRLCLCVVEPTAANNVIENLLPAADEWTRCERDCLLGWWIRAAAAACAASDLLLLLVAGCDSGITCDKDTPSAVREGRFAMADSEQGMRIHANWDHD